MTMEVVGVIYLRTLKTLLFLILKIQKIGGVIGREALVGTWRGSIGRDDWIGTGILVAAQVLAQSYKREFNFKPKVGSGCGAD